MRGAVYGFMAESWGTLALGRAGLFSVAASSPLGDCDETPRSVEKSILPLYPEVLCGDDFTGLPVMGELFTTFGRKAAFFGIHLLLNVALKSCIVPIVCGLCGFMMHPVLREFTLQLVCV